MGIFENKNREKTLFRSQVIGNFNFWPLNRVIIFSPYQLFVRILFKKFEKMEVVENSFLLNLKWSTLKILRFLFDKIKMVIRLRRGLLVR